jgi:hypothetical protein
LTGHAEESYQGNVVESQHVLHRAIQGSSVMSLDVAEH